MLPETRPGAPSPIDFETTLAKPSDRVDDLKPGDLLDDKFKIREEIGEGGMGAVFAADQIEPVHRRVAIKVIKAGMDSVRVVARFAQERQALALMDHPNIARIYDGGLTRRGRPYFAMEYVRGLPLTQFCDQEKLSLRQRIGLFITICQAVQHAHQKGIIHRDLKPSNILVALLDGQPTAKVIDFGVAKALHQDLTDHSVYTAQQAIVGTFEYMAPEQAGMSGLDIDTRADIYSLGVILYQLVCGELPLSRHDQLKGDLDQVIRAIRDVEPMKPSTRVSAAGQADAVAARRQLDPKRLRSLLRGDLDWVVMKCLEKERDRRYSTANGLAADLERYLREEPVVAAPPSTAYRLRKFYRRNSGAVLASALAVAILIGAVIISALGWSRALQAEQLAKNEVAIQKMLLHFFRHDLFDPIDPSEQFKAGLQIDPNVSVLTLIDKCSQDLRNGALADRLPEQAALRVTLAKAYAFLGKPEPAIEHITHADRIYSSLHPPRPDDHLEAIVMLGQVYYIFSRNADALAAFDRADKIFRDLGQTECEAALNVEYMRAITEKKQNHGKESEERLTSLLPRLTASLGAMHSATFRTRRALGEAANDAKRYDEAENKLKDVIADSEKAFGPNHPGTIGALNSLGIVKLNRGTNTANAAALTLYQDLLERCKFCYAEKHALVASYKINAATALLYNKQFDQAEDWLAESVPILETAKANPKNLLQAKSNLAMVKFVLAKYEDSAAIYESLLPQYKQVFGTELPNTMRLMEKYSSALIKLDRLDKMAEVLIEQQVYLYAQKNPDAGLLATSAERLGQYYELKGKYTEAVDVLTKAIKILPADSPQAKDLMEQRKSTEETAAKARGKN